VVIRQNRAVPILLVLTFAFILYLGGCFDSDSTSIAVEESPTPVPTPTAAPIVNPEIDIAQSQEEPFYHTVESGDRLGSIASKYNVTVDVIIRSNPQMNPNLIIAGEQLRIPGAGTNNEVLNNDGPDRADGVIVNYVVEPGDTLSAIANRWTVSLEALLKANPEANPASLQVNQLLIIPPWGSGIDASELRPRVTPVASNRQPGDPPLEHEVEAGDFISAIATLYNVKIIQIVEANGLANGGNSIQVGQVLLIPPPLASEAGN
jgi:LysM repeat protein